MKRVFLISVFVILASGAALSAAFEHTHAPFIYSAPPDSLGGSRIALTCK